MLQDVLRGAPTEVGVINGAVVAEGRRLGVAIPTNRMLAQLVTALEGSYLDSRSGDWPFGLVG
jgi:2-dehydropantoate 2-reductase